MTASVLVKRLHIRGFLDYAVMTSLLVVALEKSKAVSAGQADDQYASYVGINIETLKAGTEAYTLRSKELDFTKQIMQAAVLEIRLPMAL